MLASGEAEWIVVSVCCFFLGAMWTYLTLTTWGTPRFAENTLIGTVAAALGISLSRTIKLIQERRVVDG